MAELSLELAALAVAAVPDLDVAAALEHTFGAHGDFDAALLTLADGETVIARRPTSSASPGTATVIGPFSIWRGRPA